MAGKKSRAAKDAARITRAQRTLKEARSSDLRRLSPSENVKAGNSPKSRRYVPKNVKRITKATRTLSARAYETKRAGERFGLSPEQATEARRQGAIDYVTADQRSRVDKAARTRIKNRIVKGAETRTRLPTNSPNPRKHGRSIMLRPGDAERYQSLKQRRLAGEELPISDWVWMIDVGEYFGDLDVGFMRGSPASGGFGFAA